jgi:hypothetical protein
MEDIVYTTFRIQELESLDFEWDNKALSGMSV